MAAERSATLHDILEARDALRRIQTGRVWFEPHSDCLDPIIEAIRALDRLAWRLGKIARALHADTHRLTRQAVVDFHKSKGTWPQPDHIYPEMRGERDAH